MLAQRRKKKDDLKGKFLQVHESIEQKAQEFNDRLVVIANQESVDIANIESEIQVARVQAVKQIDEELRTKKNERLSAMEKRLELLKKAGKNEEMGDLLNEYGKLVKQVESELLSEKEKQESDLEKRLQNRKQHRKMEILKNREERE